MPFTAAHPAAVLPLRNWSSRFLPWSALVIGSLAPDMEYFIFFRPVSKYGHSLAGLIYFCLPVGLIVWLCFHLVLKRPMSYLLPDSERPYFWASAIRRVDLTPRTLACVGLAIVVGALTHLLWDAFTHAGRWGTDRFRGLTHSLGVVQGYEVTVYRVLQHGSTVAGTLLLALAYWHWRRLRPASECPAPALIPAWKTLFLFVLITVPAVLAYFSASSVEVSLSDLNTFRPFVGRFVISGVSFASLGLLVYSSVVMLGENQLTKCCS